jgi:hypothetical protein
MLFKIYKKSKVVDFILRFNICLVMLNLNTTIAAIILSRLYFDTSMSQIMQRWVINIHLSLFSTLIIVGGKISNLVGNRKVFSA